MASISNITRRILSRRRNSTSSNSSRLSIFDSNSSSNDKLSAMPGSYPLRSDENCIRENCELEKESTSTDLVIWQKLRRNVSTPNFQQRHLTQHNLLYIIDKNLPPIPVVGTRRRKEL
nr:2189_t:CDS:1 [Entrophospora candida]